MTETKYGHLIKQFSFQDYGPGSYRQGTKVGKDFFGYDLSLEFGTFWSAGKIGHAPYDAETHDYDQVMIWMGANCHDLGYLGAEVEMYMGEEMEKQVITTSTAIAIPKGMPHMPATIDRMENRFISMTISMAPVTNSNPVHFDKTSEWRWGPLSHFKDYVKPLGFFRNGPWHYGPRNADTHEGSITDIDGKGFDFNMSYESMNKAPYRFGPIPDKPHVHPYTEFLVFMGADCNDLSNLGAEIECCMGKEMERHIITTPTVAIQPKGHPHCPVIVHKQEKPWIFCVIRPWGHSGEGQNGYLP